jgi:hypothetical protein
VRPVHEAVNRAFGQYGDNFSTYEDLGFWSWVSRASSHCKQVNFYLISGLGSRPFALPSDQEKEFAPHERKRRPRLRFIRPKDAAEIVFIERIMLETSQFSHIEPNKATHFFGEALGIALPGCEYNVRAVLIQTTSRFFVLACNFCETLGRKQKPLGPGNRTAGHRPQNLQVPRPPIISVKKS